MKDEPRIGEVGSAKFIASLQAACAFVALFSQTSDLGYGISHLWCFFECTPDPGLTT